MNRSKELIPAGEVLARIEAALDCLDPRRADVPPEQRLEWVSTARRLRGRIDALTGVLTAEADVSQAAERTAGTPMASWLGTTEVISRKEANRDVYAARNLGQRKSVGRAATDGRINTGQAAAIGRVLDSIDRQLDATQKSEAETLLVTMADTMDAGQLARSAPQVLRQVIPERAEETLEKRLQRQAEAAHHSRYLRFFTQDGAMRFEGSLPLVDGELFQATIRTHQDQQRRTAIEQRDPAANLLTADQRRADALIALLNTAGKSAPKAGVGTPRVSVVLSYDRLHTSAAGAGLIGESEPISAGELRRLCCDADLIPAVLGTDSEPLDVGHTHRLVTRPVRDALTLRDGGCAFPGCGIRPELCEAHHIQPWWQGGVTALSNLVLLCRHHHRQLEPAKHTTRDQWIVHIDEDAGLPVFTPPARFRQLHHQQARPSPRANGELASTASGSHAADSNAPPPMRTE